MIKIIPTSEQVKTIQKYGLRFEDVVLGPGDGEITAKDIWKLGANERWYVIDRKGEIEMKHKNPFIK